jgi:chromosomal replication initiator protein
MTQFTDSVQAGQMNDFRHRFRDVDVLVVDDIHFLAKMEKTQEEFFHTFNSLYQAGKQIILSSDAAPHDIPALEQRLVSRFRSGMVGEMQMPGYETRMQIVRQKARIRGLEMPDDVVAFIAGRISANIRELEGAIVRIQMQSIAEGRAITGDLASVALDAMAPASTKAEVTINAIIGAVVEYYGVKVADLQSKRRQKSIAHPRQVCMYLARKYTRFSLEEIGGFFGGRDHTTVMHAVRAVDERRQGDAGLSTALQTIELQIRPGTGTPNHAPSTAPVVISNHINIGHATAVLPN